MMMMIFSRLFCFHLHGLYGLLNMLMMSVIPFYFIIKMFIRFSSRINKFVNFLIWFMALSLLLLSHWFDTRASSSSSCHRGPVEMILSRLLRHQPSSSSSSSSCPPMQWQVYYKLVCLRCISFAFDYFVWTPPPSQVEKENDQIDMSKKENQNSDGDDEIRAYKDFQKIHASSITLSTNSPSHRFHHHVSLITFLSYIFYPPVYIAGPIISFNAWYQQIMMIIKKEQNGVHWYEKLKKDDEIVADDEMRRPAV
jgi:D-alanyl-lipoteichoic acid acyltransferase DltB (MBOAT superfamily)